MSTFCKKHGSPLAKGKCPACMRLNGADDDDTPLLGATKADAAEVNKHTAAAANTDIDRASRTKSQRVIACVAPSSIEEIVRAWPMNFLCCPHSDELLDLAITALLPTTTCSFFFSAAALRSRTFLTTNVAWRCVYNVSIHFRCTTSSIH